VRVVTANVEGRDVASFTEAVKRKIAREVDEDQR
jgi:Cu/Ag efflux pump CusA